MIEKMIIKFKPKDSKELEELEKFNKIGKKLSKGSVKRMIVVSSIFGALCVPTIVSVAGQSFEFAVGASIIVGVVTGVFFIYKKFCFRKSESE
jgi:hypothetical protein